MSEIISKEDVLKVAKLARINLSEVEQEKFSKELSNVLDSFKDLSNLDVSEVQPVNFLKTEQNQLRKDEARENNEEEKEKIRKLFPDREGNHLKVKAVL